MYLPLGLQQLIAVLAIRDAFYEAESGNNHDFVSDWHTSENIEALEGTVRPGDRLEFNRHGFGYAYLGIYIGQHQNMDHAVFHFGIVEGGSVFSTKNISGSAFAASQKPEKQFDTIRKILGGYGKVRINNLIDELIQFLNRLAIDVACYNHYGLVGDWHTSENIEALEETVWMGDRLEFNRGDWYAHWGIYVGRHPFIEEDVIHFGMFEGGLAYFAKKMSGITFVASQKPEIRADTIRKILGGRGKVRINNSRDKQIKPLDPNDIVEMAKTMHRDKTPIDYIYNLIANNCEHFVNLCRYGKPYSEQISAAADSFWWLASWCLTGIALFVLFWIMFVILILFIHVVIVTLDVLFGSSMNMMDNKFPKQFLENEIITVIGHCRNELNEIIRFTDLLVSFTKY